MDRETRSEGLTGTTSLAVAIVTQLVIAGSALLHLDTGKTVLVRAAPAPVVEMVTAHDAPARGAGRPGEVVVHQVVMDGQSLVNFPRDGLCTAEWAAALLEPTSVRSVAVDGTSYAERAATFDERVAPLLRDGGAVLVDLGGQSDLLSGMPARRIFDEMVTYHRRARSAGAVMTIVSTVPPIGEGWSGMGPVEQERQRLNEMLRVTDEFDAVADLAALPAATDPLDPRFYSDQIHPTELLAEGFARLLIATLRAAQPEVEARLDAR